MPTTAPASAPATAPRPTLADGSDHTADLAAIEALIAGVAAGVTARDPEACVDRFAADVRSVTGARHVGHEAVHRAHVAAFAAGGVPERARFALLDVLFVRPDVAVATSAGHRGDAPEPTTLITWTLVRQDDDWWVAARHFSPTAAAA